MPQSFNMKFTSAALLLCTLAFCSCSSMPSTPHFQDTKAAVTKAQEGTTRATTHVQKSQASVQRAQTMVIAQAERINRLEQVVAENKDAHDLVLQIKTDNDSLTKELNDTQAALTQAYTELGFVKGDLGTAQQTIVTHEGEMKKVDAKLAKAAITEKKYHRLKYGICILVAGAVAGLMAKFGKPLLALGWIGIGIMIAAPIAVFTLLMFLL